MFWKIRIFFSDEILTIHSYHFHSKIGKYSECAMQNFFFINFFLFLHVSRTNNIPSFSRNSSFGCFFSIGRTKVAFSGNLKLHSILSFLEGMIVLLPGFENILWHAFIDRIRILGFSAILIESRNGIRCKEKKK